MKKDIQGIPKVVILFEILVLMLGVVFSIQLNNIEQRFALESNNRYEMMQLADRLRQSSDDLTHFARTYVVTGDKDFKEQYFTTLKIRNGEMPRPLNYNAIYWDLHKEVREESHSSGDQISLKALMKKLPYTKDELDLLTLSEKNSKELVNLEVEAFNAMDGKFKDKNGSFTIIGEPNQILAINLMHSKKYYHAKHLIMYPIDKFILNLDKRTKSLVNNLREETKKYYILLIVTIIVFIIGNYYVLRYLNKLEKKKVEEKSDLLVKQQQLNDELKEKSEVTSKLNRELEESEHELTAMNNNLQKMVREAEELNQDLEESNILYERQADFLDKILNAQTNFTIVTNGTYAKKANDTMLKFFGYDSLEQFSKEHDCICDFFIDEDGYLAKENDGKSWFDIIFEDLNKNYQVKMKDLQGKAHIFQIEVSKDKIQYEDAVVLVFTDITELAEYRVSLEDKVNEQIEQLRQKDIQLLEKSKMAQMGEMIGNIAHQWRQSLSVISTGATGLKLQKECNMLTDEHLIKTCDSINDNAQYLSQTIDTFRNFIRETKEYKEVIVQESLEEVIKLLEASLQNNHINLKKDIEETQPIKINMIAGELSQVLINIINNAKDVLIDRNIEDALIDISLKTNDNKVVISIEDNAGGIPVDILPKIFDPYFTTKHQSIGTGLGLYMSYKIITENLNGNLYAQNMKNGAKFIVELPF